MQIPEVCLSSICHYVSICLVHPCTGILCPLGVWCFTTLRSEKSLMAVYPCVCLSVNACYFCIKLFEIKFTVLAYILLEADYHQIIFTSAYVLRVNHIWLLYTLGVGKIFRVLKFDL